MFCNLCNRYITHALSRIHNLGHTFTHLGAIMTQPNPDQSALNDVTDALNNAFPLVQAQTQGTATPLDMTALVAAAQQFVDLGGPTPTP